MALFVFCKEGRQMELAGRYGSAVLPGREASFYFSTFVFPLSKDTASLSIPVFVPAFFFYLSLLL